MNTHADDSQVEVKGMEFLDVPPQRRPKIDLRSCEIVGMNDWDRRMPDGKQKQETYQEPTQCAAAPPLATFRSFSMTGGCRSQVTDF
ncbi:MAG: hypothetical protein ACKV0T_01665 [Planctomycetales bacterium]